MEWYYLCWGVALLGVLGMVLRRTAWGDRLFNRCFPPRKPDDLARCTEAFTRALYHAQLAARSQHTTIVDTQHLLMGLLRVEEGQAFELLTQHGITPQKFESFLHRNSLSFPPIDQTDPLTLSAAAKDALKQAVADAQAQKSSDNWRIGTQHLLLGVLSSKPAHYATEILVELGVDIGVLRDSVRPGTDNADESGMKDQ